MNRELMMQKVIFGLKHMKNLPPFTLLERAVNCHHNYVELEHHFGESVYVTRKGAARARANDLGIIPGSMGAKSFIVRGLGSQDSFCRWFALRGKPMPNIPTEICRFSNKRCTVNLCSK